jgi:Uma2 family endonuclease
MSSRSSTTASGAADGRRARDGKTAVWARPRSGPTTFEDFCAIVREDQKADLIDGVIYMASPENIDANDLKGWLYTVMRLFARKRKLGRVFVSRVACRLDNKNAPEPDILFVSAKHEERIRRGGIEGPPDLALEIVSPDSVERDYDKKRRQYQRFKVPEYWVVDEEEQKVTLLRLNARGRYQAIPARKGVFHSKALKGFRLDPRWLWQDPRPDELEILQQLLES